VPGDACSRNTHTFGFLVTCLQNCTLYFYEHILDAGTHTTKTYAALTIHANGSMYTLPESAVWLIKLLYSLLMHLKHIPQTLRAAPLHG
jgi:hypothetical protein